MSINRILIACMLFTVCMPLSAEEKSEKMENQAIKTVEAYLSKNGLPIQNLKPFSSSASPKPDFAFLYTGGGRCIEFIVNCFGSICTDLAKYPYDEHQEKCP